MKEKRDPGVGIPLISFSRLVCDCLLCFFIKYMDLLSIQCKFYGIACSCCCSWIHSCSHACAFIIEVQEYFCTEHLVYTDLSFDHGVRRSLKECRLIMHIFRTDTKYNGLSIVSAVDQLLSLCCRQFDLGRSCYQVYLTILYFTGSIYKVHLRRSDESCYEQVARIIIQCLRCIYLLNNTSVH